MFAVEDRVKHLPSGLIGTVYLVRAGGSGQELRVLFDANDTVYPWVDGSLFQKV